MFCSEKVLEFDGITVIKMVSYFERRTLINSVRKGKAQDNIWTLEL